MWLDCELRLNAQLFTLRAKRAANKAEAQEQHEPSRRLRHGSCNGQNADEVAGRSRHEFNREFIANERRVVVAFESAEVAGAVVHRVQAKGAVGVFELV